MNEGSSYTKIHYVISSRISWDINNTWSSIKSRKPPCEFIYFKFSMLSYFNAYPSLNLDYFKNMIQSFTGKCQGHFLFWFCFKYCTTPKQRNIVFLIFKIKLCFIELWKEILVIFLVEEKDITTKVVFCDSLKRIKYKILWHTHRNHSCFSNRSKFCSFKKKIGKG